MRFLLSRLILPIVCLAVNADGVFTNGTIPDGYGVGPAMKYEYVTAMMKGRTNGFAIAGGNAQGGTLDTQYDGPRPTRDKPAPTNPYLPIQNCFRAGTLRPTCLSSSVELTAPSPHY